MRAEQLVNEVENWRRQREEKKRQADKDREEKAARGSKPKSSPLG
jgi:hypothetical protein